MSLAEKLDELRAGSAKRLPEEMRTLAAELVKNLRASAILDGVIKVGDTLPPFALANRDGVEVRSGDLLAAGPLVLTVFRGSW